MSQPPGEPMYAPEFWETEEGIVERLAMLESALEVESFSQAIVHNGLGLRVFMFEGPEDSKNCPICKYWLGAIFREYDYMPPVPIHPNCRHWITVAEGSPGG